jgi:hypothetical protein
MRSGLHTVAITILAGLALGERLALADPTVAECLAASDASAGFAKDHKLRAEKAQLLVCSAPTCPAEIRKDCLGHVDEVNGEVPTIIFEAKNGAGADLNAVKVTMDGEIVTQKLDGTALSVDPGEHSFTFETEGQPSVTKVLTVQQSQKDRHEVILLGPPAAPVGPSPAPTPEPSSAGMGTQRVIAIATGGVALVGIGLGAAFGGIAMSDKSSAENGCPNNRCTQAGSSKWSDAVTAGNVSTVGFIVGGVALAGAATLWFTAHRTPAASVQVGFGPGMMQMRGRW